MCSEGPSDPTVPPPTKLHEKAVGGEDRLGGRGHGFHLPAWVAGYECTSVSSCVLLGQNSSALMNFYKGPVPRGSLKLRNPRNQQVPSLVGCLGASESRAGRRSARSIPGWPLRVVTWTGPAGPLGRQAGFLPAHPGLSFGGAVGVHTSLRPQAASMGDTDF